MTDLNTMTPAADAKAARALPAGLVKKTTSYNLDPKRITRQEGWNVRFDFGEIAALADSIETELKRDPSDGGLLNPVRVKRVTGNPNADFELIDGDRRLTAIELLMEKGVEFPMGIKGEIVDRNQDAVTSTIQMITANTGKPFLPLEEAAAYKRLRDAGMTIADICKAVGRTDVHVRETLDLVEHGADEVKDAVQKGKVSGSTAKVIVSVAKGDKAKQAELAAAAAAVKAAPTAAAKKTASKALQAKIQAQRDAKATAAGKEVKMRALTDDQLSEIGAKLAKHLTALLKEAKIDVATTQAALQEWAKADEKLACAYVAGAMDALKVAGGLKIDLAI